MADANEPVPAGYRHRGKIAVPRAEMVAGGLRTKWYEVRPDDYVVSAALERESRERVRADAEEKRVDFGSTMGFVLLHIANANRTAMLIVCSWRNANEIWETVYLKDLESDGPYVRYDRSGHLPTFCVWELGVVWHERNAFTRFLESPRGPDDVDRYFRDRLEGRV